MIKPDDDCEATFPEKQQETAVTLRLDPEHTAALLRIANFEKMSNPETLRKLIRIADQMISGKESPFASRLEHLLLPARKAG